MRNEGLVRRLTREWVGTAHRDFDDMLQEAMIGLMRAAELFDPTRGLKFSTYARWFIRLKVFRTLGKATVVRVPRREWAKGRVRREESLADFDKESEIPANGGGRSPLEILIDAGDAAEQAASIRACFDELTDDEWLAVSREFGLDSEERKPARSPKAKALLDAALAKLKVAYLERMAG